MPLDIGDQAAIGRLPDECRWLQYWGNRIRHEDMVYYLQIERTEMRLLGRAAELMYRDYLSDLKKAREHKLGTKKRLTKILGCAYYFSNYVHPYLVAGGKEQKTKEALDSFWKGHLNEIMENLDILDGFQLQSILRLFGQSRDFGLEFEKEVVSKLESATSRLGNPVLLLQTEEQLKTAEHKLSEGETITALVLADQSLELFLKDLCLRLGCRDDTQNEKGRFFNKWGLTEYLDFLDKAGEIDENEKTNFYSFHEWRNCAQHKGLEPSLRITKLVIDEITKFINGHR